MKSIKQKAQNKGFNINKRCIIILSFVLIIAFTLTFIFTNSMRNKEESSEQSGVFVDFLKPMLDPNNRLSYEEMSNIIRKAAHFSEFCLLGFECMSLSYYFYRKITLKGILYSVGFSLFSADVDELIQSFTERGSSVRDVMIDFLGSCTGIAISCLFCFLINKLIQYKTTKHN